MSSPAITNRLRDLARQLDARGLVVKGVDMSTAAVTTRLKTLAALSDMCRRLGRIGQPLREGTEGDPPHSQPPAKVPSGAR